MLQGILLCVAETGPGFALLDLGSETISGQLDLVFIQFRSCWAKVTSIVALLLAVYPLKSQ